jgi:hypothetical protein
MTVPANLSAAFFGRFAGHAVISIATPLNGSIAANNSIAEAISGTASSSAGNITSVQYQIDGGAWQSISITPAATVNYSGGNAGQIGVGSHTVTVKTTDAANNTAQVSSSYSIAAVAASPSYSWTPTDTYNGQNNYLVIRNAVPNATVQYQNNEYDAHGNVLTGNQLITLGTTDANGNFSYTGTAAWAINAWTDYVNLYVSGINVANFSFANFGNGPSYSYTPSVAPSGAITLSIANSWANSVVAQTITYSPSGRTVGPTALGSTSVYGNFSAGSTLSWGSDTSASISVTLAGQLIANYSFTP